MNPLTRKATRPAENLRSNSVELSMQGAAADAEFFRSEGLAPKWS